MGIVQVQLELHGEEDTDAEELGMLTSQLRSELLELNLDDVKPAREGDVPPGSKAVDPVASSALVVSLVNSPGLLQALVAAAQSWVARHGRNRIRVKLGDDELELTGHLSVSERQQLISAWVQRHASGEH
jgi:hypothetical protein